MGGEYDVVVELFADYPGWYYRVFQIFTNFNVLQSLENSQKTKLWFLRDAFDFVVVYYFLAVKDIGAGSACQNQVDKLLSAVSVVANQRVDLDVHLFLYILCAFGQDCWVEECSYSKIFLSDVFIPAGPDSRKGSVKVMSVKGDNSQIVDIYFSGSLGGKGKCDLVRRLNFPQKISYPCHQGNLPHNLVVHTCIFRAQEEMFEVVALNSCDYATGSTLDLPQAVGGAFMGWEDETLSPWFG